MCLAFLPLLLLASMLSAHAFAGELALPAIFNDHMVVQRGQPVKAWGSAAPGGKIELLFRGSHYETRADSGGRWQITIPAMEAGGPFEMTVKSGAAAETFRDVFVGDVWLAAGQSNMAFRFKFSDEKDQAVALRSAGDFNIRSYEVAKIVSGGKLLERRDRLWTIADRDTIGEWSAVAVYFSQALHQEGIAIGIINCSQGSSTIEAWMSEAAIAAARTEGYVPGETFEDIRRHYRNPTVLHRSMLANVIPYGIRGVLWYQGESNASQAASSYKILLPVLIKSWRTLWEQGDLPFLFAQLPGYEPPDDSTGQSWALFRAAQAEVDRTVPGTGMVVLIDAGDRDNIHPTNKKVVGQRFARLARARVYGEDIAYAGPSIDNVEYRGTEAILSFSHADDGLVVKGDRVRGFAVKSRNGTWREALARVSGNKIIVRHPNGQEVVGVRYGWANAPVVNVYNQNGFPAVPFNID